MKKIIFIMAAMAVLAGGCTKDNSAELQRQIDELKGKVEKTPEKFELKVEKNFACCMSILESARSGKISIPYTVAGGDENVKVTIQAASVDSNCDAKIVTKDKSSGIIEFESRVYLKENDDTDGDGYYYGRTCGMYNIMAVNGDGRTSVQVIEIPYEDIFLKFNTSDPENVPGIVIGKDDTSFKFEISYVCYMTGHKEDLKNISPEYKFSDLFQLYNCGEYKFLKEGKDYTVTQSGGAQYGMYDDIYVLNYTIEINVGKNTSGKTRDFVYDISHRNSENSGSFMAPYNMIARQNGE